MKISVPVLLLLFVVSPLVKADEILLQSGDQQNTLIELYTSEGCNSCPPAEKLLNSYKQKTSTWHQLIPLAFHVDYWDYLGWKDRFANPDHAKRQRLYARQQKRNTVYTPAFFVNGKNWRPGFFSNTLPAQSGRKVGNLKVRISKGQLYASFTPATAINRQLHLNLALLGMGYKTAIKAGENAGRLSPHEFVVLHHVKQLGNHHRWRMDWPFNKPPQAEQYALAAWVNTTDDLTPIQATGNYLPAGFINQE